MVRLPAIELVAVSVPVMVCEPARSSVALRLARPLVSAESAGNTTPAEVSLLRKCTFPAYPESVFPYGSRALTVKGKLDPAAAVPGAPVSASWLAGAAVTARLTVLERLFARSDTVRVCVGARIKVAEKAPWPSTRVESGGRTTPAVVSVLAKWMVPL